MQKWTAGLLLLLVVAFWGATFPVVDVATRNYGVMSFLFLRFSLAALVVGVACSFRIEPRTLMVGMLIGLVPGLAYVAQTYGLQYTSSTNVGLITGMSIVFVPVVNWLLFRVTTGWVFWLGIAVSVGGLCLLTGRGPSGSGFGDLLGLLCALGFGTHIALLDRFAEEHKALSLAFGQLLSMALLFGLSRPFCEPAVLPDLEVQAAIVITGVLGSAAAFFVQAYAQQELRAVQVAAIIMAEPVFAAIFSRWWLNELLVEWQWVGAGLMVGAIVLVSLQPSKHEGTSLTSLAEDRP